MSVTFSKQSTSIQGSSGPESVLAISLLLALIVPLQSSSAQVAGDQLPKVDLVGIPDEYAKLVEDAYEDAKKDPRNADKVGELGMILMRTTKLIKSAECFDFAIKLQPTEMRWYYYQGIVKEQLLETNEAEKLFRKCLQLDPYYAPTTIRLANLLAHSDPKQAETLYQSAEKLSPKDSRIYYGLGECARIQGQTEKSLGYYLKAIEIAPQYALAHGALARIYEERGDKINANIHRTAEKNGREPKVVKDPRYVELIGSGASGDWLLETANQLIVSGDFDLASKFIERAAKSKQFTEEAHKQQGLLAYYRQDYAKAADYLFRYLSEIRGDEDTRIIFARALIELKRYDDAGRELRTAVNSHSDNLEARELNAIVSLIQGRSEAAVVDLKVVLRQDPKRQRANSDLVVAYVSSGKYDDALKAYRFALRAFDSPVELDEQILISLLTLIRCSEYTTTSQRAIIAINRGCFPTFADFLSKAEFTESADRFRNYLKSIASVIERNASISQYGMAFALVDKLGEADEGGYIRDAMSKTIQTLARTSADGTTQFFSDNIKQSANEPVLAMQLAWIRATSADSSLRNAKEAVMLAESADKATSHKNPEVMDTLAAAYAETGDFDRAIRTVDEALQTDRAKESAIRRERFEQRLALYKKGTPYRY
jgi:tetratricopeptide (TPR) repeat protein